MNNTKFSFKRIFLLGFGFLGVSMIWSMYNLYVPVFLKNSFHLSSTVIGMIMTIDNILAILLLPFLGALSDRTHTRIGRRRPFILLGAPLAAIFFIFIPFFNFYQNLGIMMFFIIMMNLSMAIFRSPVIALMPDVTPSQYRSQANGVVNFMGGLGSLLVFFGGKPLYDTNPTYPFIICGIIMFLVCMLVVIFVKEDKSQFSEHTKASVTFKKSYDELVGNLKDVFAGEKSLFFILLAIFFWFVGFNALETFFTSYAKYYLGLGESTGGQILGFFSFAFMLTAIISGYIGSKLSRKRTIRIGLVIVIIMAICALFLKDFMLLSGLYIIGGFGWALVLVNSLPMVMDMTTIEKIGGYTGLYYFFSQAASIISPPLAGFCIDKFGYPSLMIYSAVMFIISVVMLQSVKRGEAVKAPA